MTGLHKLRSHKTNSRHHHCRAFLRSRGPTQKSKMFWMMSLLLLLFVVEASATTTASSAKSARIEKALQKAWTLQEDEHSWQSADGELLNKPVGYTPNDAEYASFLECGLKADTERKERLGLK